MHEEAFMLLIILAAMVSTSGVGETAASPQDIINRLLEGNNSISFE